MFMRDFPYCCTANILCEFSSNQLKPLETQYTVEAIRNYTIDSCLRLKNGGWALVVATTTDGQVNANKALEELGFKHTEWIEKTKHPESKVRMWWIELGTFRAPEGWIKPAEVKKDEKVISDHYWFIGGSGT